MKPEFSIFATGITDTKVLYRLIDKLNAVIKDLYHNKEGTITQKAPEISPSLVAVFNYLEQKGLEPAGDEAQKAYITEIINYLKKLPIVKVTLAFEPNSTFSNKINEVISSLLGHKIILDFEVNPQIVAGIALEYKGKFADYSYMEKTTDFLKERLGNFLTTASKEEKVKSEPILN